jgi:hypothetical protein
MQRINGCQRNTCGMQGPKGKAPLHVNAIDNFKEIEIEIEIEIEFIC